MLWELKEDTNSFQRHGIMSLVIIFSQIPGNILFGSRETSLTGSKIDIKFSVILNKMENGEFHSTALGHTNRSNTFSSLPRRQRQKNSILKQTSNSFHPRKKEVSITGRTLRFFFFLFFNDCCTFRPLRNLFNEKWQSAISASISCQNRWNLFVRPTVVDAFSLSPFLFSFFFPLALKNFSNVLLLKIWPKFLTFLI